MTQSIGSFVGGVIPVWTEKKYIIYDKTDLSGTNPYYEIGATNAPYFVLKDMDYF